MCVGKNVTLELDNIMVVQGYMNRTRSNFSQTLNVIISEWDDFSMALQKMKAESQANEKVTELKAAKVIKSK